MAHVNFQVGELKCQLDSPSKKIVGETVNFFGVDLPAGRIEIEVIDAPVYVRLREFQIERQPEYAVNIYLKNGDVLTYRSRCKLLMRLDSEESPLAGIIG